MGFNKLNLIWMIPLFILILIFVIYESINITKATNSLQNTIHITNQCESLKDYCKIIQCKLFNKEVYNEEYISSLIIINNEECKK